MHIRIPHIGINFKLVSFLCRTRAVVDDDPCFLFLTHVIVVISEKHPTLLTLPTPDLGAESVGFQKTRRIFNLN